MGRSTLRPPFPLEQPSFQTARSRPGREAAKRTLDGEDRSEIIQVAVYCNPMGWDQLWSWIVARGAELQSGHRRHRPQACAGGVPMKTRHCTNPAAGQGTTGRSSQHRYSRATGPVTRSAHRAGAGPNGAGANPVGGRASQVASDRVERPPGPRPAPRPEPPLSPRKQRVFRLGPEPSRARSGEANH